MNWQRIRQMVKKEFIQIRRDRRMVALLTIAPVLQLIIFGYAVTTDIKNVSTAVIDRDNSRESRQLLAGFTNSGYFVITHWPDNSKDAIRLLDDGSVRAVIEIPTGFARDLSTYRPAPVQMLVDGTDSSATAMIMSYASGIVGRFSQDVLAERGMRSRGRLGRLPTIDEQARVWYNPELKSVNFMVPGVLAMILLITTMMMTSLAVVREREIGTLEQLIVTPIRPSELIVAKMLPFIIIGFVDIMLITLVAVGWFRVPLQGSFVLLLALTAGFLTVSLGLGLLVSTVSRTQQQAMMTSFFIMQPSVLLSGFLFPIENMPRAIQTLTYILPLRYYVSIVRGIFLKGSGPDVLWPQVVPLLVIGATVLIGGIKRFHKKME